MDALRMYHPCGISTEDHWKPKMEESMLVPSATVMVDTVATTAADGCGTIEEPGVDDDDDDDDDDDEEDCGTPTLVA